MSQLRNAAGSLDETHRAERTDRSPVEWQRAHDELLRLARSRAGLDFEEGRWLVRACRSGVHARLGFGPFSEHVGRLFGYGARLVQEKLRVGEALERLPAFAKALKQGQICWSALREITRVATPQTEAAWLAAATGRTVRELEIDHRLRSASPRAAPGRSLRRGNASKRAEVPARGRSAYGRLGAPAAADATAKAFRAPRALGFRESEVRWALGQLTRAGGAESVEAQVRACLLLLTRRLAHAS